MLSQQYLLNRCRIRDPWWDWRIVSVLEKCNFEIIETDSESYHGTNEVNKKCGWLGGESTTAFRDILTQWIADDVEVRKYIRFGNQYNQ